MRDAAYTSNPYIIGKQENMISINSAIEVDLTGQAGADSICTRMYSSTGGQVDFVYGASMSDGGKSTIALTSRSQKGPSRIVSCLAEGAGIVTTRSHVQYLVTEYGIASVRGKSSRERCHLASTHQLLIQMIEIAR